MPASIASSSSPNAARPRSSRSRWPSSSASVSSAWLPPASRRGPAWPGPAPCRASGPGAAPARAPPASARRRVRSSMVSKCGATPASSGNRRSSAPHSAWMVITPSPRGSSSTCANSRRARSSRSASAGSPVELQQLRRQRGVVGGRGPARQPLLDAAGHLGGGRLGEGEADDAFRVGAAEQQPEHPIGQHAGLAGAGIGGDPDRAARGPRPAAGPASVRAPRSSLALRAPPLADAGQMVIVVVGGAISGRGTGT